MFGNNSVKEKERAKHNKWSVLLSLFKEIKTAGKPAVRGSIVDAENYGEERSVARATESLAIHIRTQYLEGLLNFHGKSPTADLLRHMIFTDQVVVMGNRRDGSIQTVH